MLDRYFITDIMPASAMQGSYDYMLVAVSYLIASFGSFVGLTLASMQAMTATRLARIITHVSGAFALGAGIWSMHFVGMLAYTMPMAVQYDPLLTIISMAIAIAVAYGVLQIANFSQPTKPMFVNGALLLGIAICAMHYTGMAAMKMDADLRYTPGLFFVSFLIAVTAGGAALWIVFSLGRTGSSRQLLWRGIAALVMGAAICGMHYTGMAAAIFIPSQNMAMETGQDSSMLAFSIAAVTGLLFSIAVFAGLYARERRLPMTGSEYSFPIRLLIFSLALTIVTMLWSGGNGLYLYHTMAHGIRKDIEAADMSGDIVHYEDLLLRNAKMYVITGDPQWEQKYKGYITSLDDTIDRLKTYNLPPVLHDDLVYIDRTGDFLEDLNAKAFALVHQGRRQQAADFIESTEYTSRELVYTDRIYDLTTKADRIFSDHLQALLRNISYTVYSSLFVVTLLLVAWYFSFRSIRQWRLQLENTRSELYERGLELQRSIGEIEVSQTAAMKAQAAAEKANSAKSDFLANMSHEIRTPMNGVLGMTALLADTELNAEQRGWVDIIRKSGESLLDIINDILDFSKIEAGKFALENLGFDLFGMIHDITDLLAPRVQEKGIELTVDLGTNLPRHVVGDPVRLRQILMNLVSNALKFTDHGYVLIGVECLPNSLTGTHLRFRVEDTGIGIPKDKQDYIFSKFSQAEESTTRKFGGTGLGLTISKRLVEMMGGKIGVTSELGKGSVFSFDVKLGLAEQKNAAHNVPSFELTGVRVLAVDDAEVDRRIMARYLNSWHMRVETVASVEEAKKRLTAAMEENDPYRLVFTDYRMEDSSGNDLAAWVKASSAMRDKTVLFLITAFAQAVVSGNVEERGFAGYLIKPIFPDQLKFAVQIVLDAQRRGIKIPLTNRQRIADMTRDEKRASGIRADMFPGIKVLAVEDMKTNLILITKILQKHGCKISSAVNGKEAVKSVLAERFDLVLMDCQMPEMDGFEATHLIRTEEAKLQRYTPIVALTADAMSGDREKCLNAGMDDYLNKPVRPERITDMLEKWVMREDQRHTGVPSGLLKRIGGPSTVKIAATKLADKMRADPDMSALFTETNGIAMNGGPGDLIAVAFGGQPHYERSTAPNSLDKNYFDRMLKYVDEVLHGLALPPDIIRDATSMLEAKRNIVMQNRTSA